MDALQWLDKNYGLESIVTSIPEMEEIGTNQSHYETFFRNAAHKCLKSVKDDGYCIFLQTDRKYKGWIDKTYLTTDEAYKLGFKMIWHKIALRQKVGTSGLFRPTYSHMVCYTKKGKVGKSFPDVMERGEVTYENAFGKNAVVAVLKYLKDGGIKNVVDPFVGSGTTIAIANELGMNGIGIDINKSMCKKAETLHITI